MKIFLTKIFFFSLAVVIFFFLFALLADGHADHFYLRFTTPRQNSLILGSSRAAQGIIPDVLDSALTKDYPYQKFYNFSFTIAHSPYGPVYYNAICKKLNPNSKNAFFILAVDPWSISTAQKNPNDSSTFIENRLALGQTHFINLNPNLEYLVKNYDEPFMQIIYKKFTKHDELLHKNGWLEINVPMDSISVLKRTRAKINDYANNNLPYYHFSSLRLRYLDKTIKMLNQHGKVYIVRLPVHPEILKLEETLMPGFDDTIARLSNINNIPYFNLKDSSKHYQFVDGNHLYKNSSKAVTADIANLILKNKNLE